MKKLGIFILGLMILATPMALTYAAGIIPDCNRGEINKTTGQFANPCDFEDVVLLINNIITFLLFTIATPLVALILCYVGWLLITSGGSSEKSTKAKTIFTNVVIGYVIGLAAWLIVKWITTALGFTGETFLR
jgi:hypothetical protein